MSDPGEDLHNFLSSLDSFDSKTLIGISEEVGAALSRVRDRETKDALSQMEALAEKLGFDIEDLVQKKAEELIARGTSEPVRFQHPKDKSLTWTGRGRLPRWLKDLQDSGEDVEKYRIRP